MSELNALQWRDDSFQPKQRWKKRKNTQDVEVKFDVEDLKGYVNGFRKRKEQRQKYAIQKIIKKEKETKRETKQEKARQLKEKLHLPDDYGVESSDEEVGVDDWKVKDVKVFSGAVVTTTEIKLKSDSEPESDDDEAAKQQKKKVKKYQPIFQQEKKKQECEEDSKSMKKQIKKKLKEIKQRSKQKKAKGKHKKRRR
eukprot:TRINITY_DN30740_c0_g1_i2.p2 TRINITY_DN30740_c0_g1~~TRINITY_DN30740_c0_g1_i2.p2  ORF type:complete len:197 (-),score=44.10 TRINITY_DN30740_c0_g1_i2:249-839(-)